MLILQDNSQMEKATDMIANLDKFKSGITIEVTQYDII